MSAELGGLVHEVERISYATMLEKVFERVPSSGESSWCLLIRGSVSSDAPIKNLIDLWGEIVRHRLRCQIFVASESQFSSVAQRLGVRHSPLLIVDGFFVGSTAVLKQRLAVNCFPSGRPKVHCTYEVPARWYVPDESRISPFVFSHSSLEGAIWNLDYSLSEKRIALATSNGIETIEGKDFQRSIYRQREWSTGVCFVDQAVVSISAGGQLYVLEAGEIRSIVDREPYWVNGIRANKSGDVVAFGECGTVEYFDSSFRSMVSFRDRSIGEITACAATDFGWLFGCNSGKILSVDRLTERPETVAQVDSAITCISRSKLGFIIGTIDGQVFSYQAGCEPSKLFATGMTNLWMIEQFEDALLTSSPKNGLVAFMDDKLIQVDNKFFTASGSYKDGVLLGGADGKVSRLTKEGVNLKVQLLQNANCS